MQVLLWFPACYPVAARLSFISGNKRIVYWLVSIIRERGQRKNGGKTKERLIKQFWQLVTSLRRYGFVCLCRWSISFLSEENPSWRLSTISYSHVILMVSFDTLDYLHLSIVFCRPFSVHSVFASVSTGRTHNFPCYKCKCPKEKSRGRKLCVVVGACSFSFYFDNPAKLSINVSHSC